MIKNKDLLEIYILGFNDELNCCNIKQYEHHLFNRAYDLGRSDAKTGDDISFSDYQTDEEILNKIYNS